MVVFNSLGWTRSELVETELDAGRVILEYPDRTPVPVEVLGHHSDYNHVRFFARDVPSMGYRCYQVVGGQEHAPAPPGETTLPASNVIENDYYRIEVDPAAGAVKSVFDKQLGRDLVDPASPYRFNQYLYVSGGDGETQLLYLRKSLPLANLTVTASSGGRVTRVLKTSCGQVLNLRDERAARAIHRVGNHPFRSREEDRVHQPVAQGPVDTKEAVYFAFPVAAAPPDFSYEIQNGWVDPARDLLCSKGRASRPAVAR